MIRQLSGMKAWLRCVTKLSLFSYLALVLDELASCETVIVYAPLSQHISVAMKRVKPVNT